MDVKILDKVDDEYGEEKKGVSKTIRGWLRLRGSIDSGGCL